MYVELIDVVGRPRARFTTDGRILGLLLHSEGKFYVGPATIRNIGLFLPFGLGLQGVFLLLTGNTPLIVHKRQKLLYLPDKGNYRLHLDGGPGGLSQVVWFSPKTHRLLKMEIRGRNSAVLLRAVFDRYKRVGTLWFPMRTILSAPTRRTKLELSYKWVKLNVAMSQRPFVVAVPEGVKIIRLKKRRGGG